MRRFFVPPEQCRGDVFELPEREARHAVQVLRLHANEELDALDGAGSVLRCQIESASRSRVRVAVRHRQFHSPPACALTLIQAVPKGPAFETIVQKATELGAARIIPLLSERVVAHVSEQHSQAKVEKWRQIAIESIKQCGSPWLPDIESPVRFETLVERPDITGSAPLAVPAGSPGGRDASGREIGETVQPDNAPTPPRPALSVVCSLEPARETMRDVAARFLAAHGRRPASAMIWIGPEGDFTPAEYAAIARTGASPITLGTLVLRADTAAIASLALAHHELQPRD